MNLMAIARDLRDFPFRNENAADQTDAARAAELSRLNLLLGSDPVHVLVIAGAHLEGSRVEPVLRRRYEPCQFGKIAGALICPGLVR
jgi:hypothetical protein